MRGRAGKCTSSERIKFVIYPICSIIYKYQPGKHTLNRAGVGKNTGKFTVRNAADYEYDKMIDMMNKYVDYRDSQMSETLCLNPHRFVLIIIYYP